MVLLSSVGSATVGALKKGCVDVSGGRQSGKVPIWIEHADPLLGCVFFLFRTIGSCTPKKRAPQGNMEKKWLKVP